MVIIIIIILLFVVYNMETFQNKPDMVLIYKNKKYTLLDVNNKKKKPITFNSMKDYKLYAKKHKQVVQKPHIQEGVSGKLLDQLLKKKAVQKKQEIIKKKNNRIDRKQYFKQPDNKIFSKYGYSFMPATSWSVPQQRPPACIPQDKCPVCPVIDKGTPVNAIETSQVGSIMPKFEFKEVYNPDYYHPGWIAGDTNKMVKDYPKYKQEYSMQQRFKPV